MDENAEEDLEFRELDIDYLGVDFLQDLLELIEDVHELGKDALTEKSTGKILEEHLIRV